MDPDADSLPPGTSPTGEPWASCQAAKDAEAIWRAGVAAVDSSRLVADAVRRTVDSLDICGERYPISSIGKLIVVGAGKAGAGMARGLERVLGSDLVQQKVTGCINVPDDCVIPLSRIHLHPARPAGVNEPTEAGVFGSERILEFVSGMTKEDICLVLISGGGSALLPLPVPGVSLADKLTLTRTLSQHGATIHELNSVRKRLSRIKGGGLARAAQAGRMIALIISDVIGDPLEIIASGPSVRDDATSDTALKVLRKLQSANPSADIPASVWTELQRQTDHSEEVADYGIPCRNVVIGNNGTALSAAMRKATELGYDAQSLGSDRQGFAKDNGIDLAQRCRDIRLQAPSAKHCLVGGGEPVVQLSPTTRSRLGGRNQEVALAALCDLWTESLAGIAILSGGTDGEDGPTDAAGAICCESVQRLAQNRGLDPFDALSINDSYTFFAACEGLLKTGPTLTNVMDLQIAVVRPTEFSQATTIAESSH